MKRLRHAHIVCFEDATITSNGRAAHPDGVLSEGRPRRPARAPAPRELARPRRGRRVLDAAAADVGARVRARAARRPPRHQEPERLRLRRRASSHVFVKLGDFGVAKALVRRGSRARSAARRTTTARGVQRHARTTRRRTSGRSASSRTRCSRSRYRSAPRRCRRSSCRLSAASTRRCRVTYSGELRTLVGSLLRQLPRDRPAADQLLRHRLLRPPPGTAAADRRRASPPPPPLAAGPSSSTPRSSRRAGDFAFRRQSPRRRSGCGGCAARTEPTHGRVPPRSERTIRGDRCTVSLPPPPPPPPRRPALHPAYRLPRAPTPPPPTPPPPVAPAAELQAPPPPRGAYRGPGGEGFAR